MENMKVHDNDKLACCVYTKKARKTGVRWAANSKNRQTDLPTLNNSDIDGRCGFTSTSGS